MKRIALMFVLLTVFASSAWGAEIPASPWEHPRLFLTAAKIETIQARVARTNAAWTAMVNWCTTYPDVAAWDAFWENGKNGDGSWNDDATSRNTLAVRALNFAILYAIDPATYPTYDTKAYDFCQMMLDSCIHHSYHWQFNARNTIQYDNWYNTRYLMPTFALVYDWCYGGLTAAQKDTLETRLNEWNNDMISWVETGKIPAYVWQYKPVSGTSNGPWGENYTLGHLMANYYSGMALMYEGPANAEWWVEYARDTLFSDIIKYTANEALDYFNLYSTTTGSGHGGYWNEGTSYGGNDSEWLVEILSLVCQVEGTTPEALGCNAAEDAMIMKMTGMWPNRIRLSGNGKRIKAEGDGVYGEYGSSERIQAWISASLATNADTASYMYAFEDTINAWTSDIGSSRYWRQLVWYDPLHAKIDYQDNLSNFFTARGHRIKWWKSSWDWNAANVTMDLGCGNSQHSRNGFGDMQIMAGNYLLPDYGVDVGSTPFGDYRHNTTYFGLDVVQGSNIDRVIPIGASTIEHDEDTLGYSYFAGDMTPIYIAEQTNPSYGWRNGHVVHKEREWFIVEADTMIVLMDRLEGESAAWEEGTVPSADDEASILWQTWAYPSVSADGSDWRIDGNRGMDLLVHRAYPTAGVASFLDTVSSRIRIVDTLQTPAAVQNYLHTLKVTASNATTDYLSGLTCHVGNYALSGWRSLAGADRDYVVAFTTDTEGDAGTGFAGGLVTLSYTTPRDTLRAYILNCTPSTAYYYLMSGDTLYVRTTAATYYTAKTSTPDGVLDIYGATGAALPGCPAVAKSSIATQAISVLGATLHFHSDTLSHADFRYHRTGNYPWAYMSDLDADSVQHTRAMIGLSPALVYVWESQTTFAGCAASGYGDSTAFTTSCPTVTTSNIATQLVTFAPTLAMLHFHTNYIANAGYRYHLIGNNPWVYTHDTDADSLQHSKLLTGLLNARMYVWESNTKYAGCDSTAYADSTEFTTTCPTVYAITHETKAITATTAKMVFVTNYNVNGRFRYHATGNNPWIYHHDADADSTSHLIALSGLTPGSVYVWQNSTMFALCDSTAYTDSTQFTTSCPTVTKSAIASQGIAFNGATLHFHTDYAAHANFRYAKYAGGSGWTYTHDADADSTQHTITITGLDAATEYKWFTNVKYAGCDSTAWADSTAFTTSADASPACDITPITLSFGTWTIGDTATAQSFVITNTGGGTLSGTVSESSAHFAITSGASYSLTAGQSQTVYIIFTPVSGGVLNGLIETGNAACNDVACSGGGVTLTPTTLAFGNVDVGDCSSSETLTITNTGTGTVSGTVSESNVDFEITSGDGAYSLAAGESLVIYIKFCPLSSGAKTCTINF